VADNRRSISIFYLVGLFDLWDGLRTMLISAGGAYAIAKFLRGSRYMPWVGFVFLMGHMSVNHIARQAANNPRSVDITGAQMVLVMKLTAFCWNVADGLLSEAELSDFQKDRRLTELPSLLDYAGFVFFFPSMLVGPAFDFVEYRRWLDTTMFEVPADVDPAKKPPTRRKRKIPRSGTPAMLKLVTSLLWIFAFLKLSAYFDHTVLLEDSYLEYGFLGRLFVLHMVGFTARTKYYGVWTLSEGACILAGLGYKGLDPLTGKVSWDRLRNIDPWGVEFAQNTRGYLESWNINTNKWLRNYIYLRVTPRGKKPGFRASLATFTTSAFWHGFFPGYYLAFVLASFIQTVAKSMFFPPTTPLHMRPLTKISGRYAPPLPSLLHRPQDGRRPPDQEILRRRLLDHDPAHLLVRRRPLPHSFLLGLTAGLEARLLLRCHRHRCTDRLLCVAREGLPQEGDREEERQGRRGERGCRQGGRG
jgi:lysophospholipid acyltransferase